MNQTIFDYYKKLAQETHRKLTPEIIKEFENDTQLRSEIEAMIKESK